MRAGLQFLLILLFYYAECQEYAFYADVKMSYKFHNVFMTWYQAKVTCNDEGGKLAMPKNADEATRIQAQFVNSPESGDQDYIFLDAHDLFQTEEYISRDLDLQYYYNSWDKGQPDRGAEHCLAMHRNKKLHDHNCKSELKFVCERENDNKFNASDKCTSPSEEPTYILSSDDKKYFKLHTTMRDWPTARAICRAEGGHLAVIENKNDEFFLKNMFNDEQYLWPHSKPNALVGFHNLYYQKAFYTVNDVNFNELSYVNWEAGYPKFAENKCGSINKEGRLVEYSCSEKAQFFCERKP